MSDHRFRFSKKNVPYEYIVYVDVPHGGGRFLRTLRIPRGKTYRDMVDILPPTVAGLKVVKAYRAEHARAAARERGLR